MTNAQKLLAAAAGLVTLLTLRVRRRGGALAGLGLPPAEHASQAGRTLMMAEENAEQAHEHAARGRCGAAYTAVMRARSSLTAAHIHAASGGLGRAMREVAATDDAVNRAAALVRRVCIIPTRE
jgi:hypothetical protein